MVIRLLVVIGAPFVLIACDMKEASSAASGGPVRDESAVATYLARFTHNDPKRCFNNTKSRDAVSAATICTGDIVTDETLAVGQDVAMREVQGQPVPPRRAVFDALAARHAAIRATLADFRARQLRAVGQRATAGL